MTYSAPQTCCRTFLTLPHVKNHNSTVRQEGSSAIEKARIELLTSGKLNVWRIKMFLWLLHTGCLNPRPLLLVRNFEEVALCVSLKMRV